MSATLDAAPVARFLGAPSLRSEGRLFEVAVEHLSPADAAPRRPARGPGGLGRPAPGDRGAGRATCWSSSPAWPRSAGPPRPARPSPRGLGLDVLPLHGDLSPEEQDRAVRPGPAPQGDPLHQRRRDLGHHRGRDGGGRLRPGARRLPLALVGAAAPGGPPGVAGLGHPAGRARRAHRAGALPPALHPPRLRHPARVRRPGDPARGPLRDRCSPWPRWAARSLALARRAPAGRRGGRPHAAPRPRGARRRRGHHRARPAAAPLPAPPAPGPAGGGGRRPRRRAGRRAARRAARRAGHAGARARTGAAARRPPAPPTCSSWPTSSRRRPRARFDPDRLRSLGLSPGRGPGGGAEPAADRPARSGAARRAGRPAAEDSEEALLLATLAAYPDRVARRRAPGSPEVVLAGRRLGPARRGERGARGAAPRRGRRRRAAGSARARGRPGLPGAAGRLLVRVASAVTPEMLLDLFPGRAALGGGARLERRGRAGRRLRADALPRPRPRGVAQAGARPGARRRRCSPRRRWPAGRAASRRRASSTGCSPASPSRPGRRRRAASPRPARRTWPPRCGRPARGAAASPSCARRASPRRSSRGSPRPAARSSSGSPRSGSRSADGRGVKVNYEAGDKPPWVESRLQDFFGSVRGPAVGRGARAARAPPARAQHARGAGDHRPGRLLGAPLPGAAARADAPLPAPRLAGGSADRPPAGAARAAVSDRPPRPLASRPAPGPRPPPPRSGARRRR